MFLRRIFKNIPDVGPWVSVAELLAAILTIAAILVGLEMIPNPFARVASGTISGVVTDVATGKAVPEATVQIIDNASRMMICESVPDANGNFKETVRPGAYTVKAVCDGYRPAAISVSVLEDKTRVVRLAIGRQTDAEATAAAQAGGASAAGVASVPAAVPNAGASASRLASRTASGSQPAGKSKAELAQEQYGLAKSYHEQGKLQEAEDACNAAVRYDHTDGNFYASLIRISLQRDNVAAAKDYADEGSKHAKRNLEEMKKAIAEISPE